jgi:hypothetical protein
MRLRCAFYYFLVFAVLARAFGGSEALGQAFVNGSVVGTVTDNTGGLMKSVTLTLTNLGTNFTLTSQSDTAGRYRFINLPLGSYRLAAENPGFKRYTRGPIIIEVNSNIQIDIPMELGNVAETVTVTAETPLLQPQTSSLGQVVQSRETNELPLNGRNPVALVALVPGVIGQPGFGQNPVLGNSFASGNFQINGGDANESAAYWDGAPLNASGYVNELALIPTQDALQEFKVMTSNLPAEYDRFAGGIVSFTSKTGSNNFHGELYEYLRNKVLNANDFFDNRSGIPVPQFTQNQFGANLGGPIILPHLYNGNDKTFFFASYDGFRLRQGVPFLTTVPTMAQQNGDFSNLRSASGTLIPIYDPATTVPDPSHPGQYLRNQISCNGVANVICPSSIDPAAAVLRKLWPMPNLPGAPLTNVNNWASNYSSGGNMDEFTIRVDHNVSDKQRIFSRYTYQKWFNFPTDPFGTDAYTISASAGPKVNQQGVIDDTYTLSPNIVADFEVTYLRTSLSVTPLSEGYDLSKLGAGWASLNGQVTFQTLPILSVSGIQAFVGATGVNIDEHTDDGGFLPNITIVKRRHTIKIGGDFRIDRADNGQDSAPSGSFTFTPSFTASSPTASGGDGFASFLLGDTANGSIQTINRISAQQLYRAYYLEDTYQVRPSLTLNLGFRYSQDGPFSERYNRISSFEPDLASPLAAQTGLPLNGALVVVDSAQRQSRNGFNADPHQFAPRAGFADQLFKTTVIRGAYGIFWLPNALSFGPTNPVQDPVNLNTTSMVTTINGGLTPYSRLGNPFPIGIRQPPGHNTNFNALNGFFNGNAIATQLPDNPYAYVQQWNLDVQQEFPGGILLDVAYAASKGTHLPIPSFQIDQLPVQDMALGSALLGSVKNPFYGLTPPLNGSLASATVTAGQLLLPYPQYTGVTINPYNRGDSNYNSLQVSSQKRFGGDQTILMAYTFSKLINDGSEMLANFVNPVAGIQNYYNLAGERSVATYDATNRLVVSYVLDLPFGEGRRYLGNLPNFSEKVVSGWGTDGIFTSQSGFPLYLTTASNLTHSYGGGSRPNFDSAVCSNGASVGGSPESRVNEWFNTSCFTQPSAFTFGNVSRTEPQLRTAGSVNLDFAAFKTTSFGSGGKFNLQFRCETFNLFNHPQFGYPGMTLGSPQFGVVSSQANNPRLIQFALKTTF